MTEKSDQLIKLQIELSERIINLTNAEQRISELVNSVNVLSGDKKKMETERVLAHNQWQEKYNLLSNASENLRKQLDEKCLTIEKYASECSKLSVQNEEKKKTITALTENVEKLIGDHGTEMNNLKKQFMNDEISHKNDMTKQFEKIILLQENLKCKENQLRETVSDDENKNELLNTLKAKLIETEQTYECCNTDKQVLESKCQLIDQEKNKLLQNLIEMKETFLSEKIALNEDLQKEKLEYVTKLKYVEENSKSTIADIEKRNTESENNYKKMIQNVQQELDANQTEMTDKIQIISDEMKANENLIISLKVSVQEKENFITSKSEEFDDKIKKINAKSSKDLVDLENIHTMKKDEMQVELIEISDKLSRTESDLLFKEEVMVQKANSDRESREKCKNLQLSLDKLESEHKCKLTEYAKQKQNLREVQRDLGSFKQGVETLQDTIKYDREAHTHALNSERTSHAKEMKDSSTKNDELLKLMEEQKQKLTSDKRNNEKSLLQKYSEFEIEYRKMKNDLNEQNNKMSKELLQTKEQKSTLETNLNESNKSLAVQLTKSRGEISVLENRVKEASISNEMVMMESTKKVQDYEVKLIEVGDKLLLISDERNKMIKTLEEKETKLNGVSDELTEKRKENEALVQDITASRVLWDSDKSNMEEITKNSTNQIVELKKSIVNHIMEKEENSLKSDEQRRQIIEELNREKRTEIEKLNNLIHEKSSQIDELKEDYARDLNNIGEHNKLNNDQQLLKLGNEMSEKESEFNKYKQNLQNEMQCIEEEKIALQNEYQSMKHSMKIYEDEKNNLEKVLSESSSSKAQLSVQKVDLEEQVKVYKSRLEEKENNALDSIKEAEVCGKEIESLNMKLGSQSKEFEDLKQTFDQKNTALDALTEEKEDLKNEATAYRQQIEEMKTRVVSVEVSLIDREKEVTEVKEEIMRVERVAENDSRSLREEMGSLKQKFKQDKQAYQEKMKGLFKGQLENILTENEKNKRYTDECEVIEHKYQTAKHKLAELCGELSEVKQSKEAYVVEINKHKEHIAKLRKNMSKEATLRNELERTCEIQKMKLQDNVNVIKLLRAEKVTLETNIVTADTQLRHIHKNITRESLGGPALSSRQSTSTLNKVVTGSPSHGTRRSTSTKGLADSYRKAIKRVHSSSQSSTEDNDELDGSDVPLLGRSTRSCQNIVAKISNNDDRLFRKPSIRIVSAESRNRGPKTPVELRALTSFLGDDGEMVELGAEEAWEEGELKFREERERREREADRKKKLVQTRDHNNQSGRRMTVDGRVITDNNDSMSVQQKTPSAGSSNARRLMTAPRSVPRGMGNVFSCEEEDQEFFSNKYLQDMKQGRCNPSSEGEMFSSRISELHRRNSLYPPHLRSVYAPEVFQGGLDEQLNSIGHLKGLRESDVYELETATERLQLESPAFNLRKRKSLSCSLISLESLNTSAGAKKTRRLSTSYSKPGPPTPARKSLGDKENRRMSLRSQTSGGSPTSTYVSTSSRRESQPPALSVVIPVPLKTTPKNTASSRRSSRGMAGNTPGGGVVTTRKRGHNTPSSIKRLLKGKSPWKRLNESNSTGEGTQRRRRNEFTQHLSRALIGSTKSAAAIAQQQQCQGSSATQS